jgi:hypothetical protein
MHIDSSVAALLQNDSKTGHRMKEYKGIAIVILNAVKNLAVKNLKTIVICRSGLSREHSTTLIEIAQKCAPTQNYFKKLGVVYENKND